MAHSTSSSSLPQAVSNTDRLHGFRRGLDKFWKKKSLDGYGDGCKEPLNAKTALAQVVPELFIAHALTLSWEIRLSSDPVLIARHPLLVMRYRI